MSRFRFGAVNFIGQCTTGGIIPSTSSSAGDRLVDDLRGITQMKFRKLMLAVLGLAVVVGMTVPANAMMAHKHHKKHHHHK
jgi:hypothetical protein